MQIALRSSLAVGVAAVGAGVIAMTPTASSPAPVAAPAPSPDVALGALADLLPPASVGSGTLNAAGNAIVVGTGQALGALPSLPLPSLPVPGGVQLSFLTPPPNLGAGNQGIFNAGLNNDGNFNIGTNNDGN